MNNVLQEKSFMELLKEAWEIFTSHFQHFLVATVVLLFPLNLIIEFTTKDVSDEVLKGLTYYDEATGTILWGDVVTFLGYDSSVTTWINISANILAIFMALLLSIIIIFVTIQAIQKKPIDLQEIGRKSLPLVWPVVSASILMLVLLIPLSILIIPGIMFTIYWIFVSYAVVLDNKRFMQALAFSKMIVKGHWWNLFRRMVLLGFISSMAIIFLWVSTDAIIQIVPGLEAVVVTIIDLMSVFVSIYLVLYYLHLKELYEDGVAKDEEKVSDTAVITV